MPKKKEVVSKKRVSANQKKYEQAIKEAASLFDEKDVKPTCFHVELLASNYPLLLLSGKRDDLMAIMVAAMRTNKEIAAIITASVMAYKVL